MKIILIFIFLFSQNLFADKIWTQEEVNQLVEQMKIIKNQAIDEAVKQAVIPLIVDNDILKQKIKGLEKKVNENLLLLSGVGVVGIGVGIILTLLVKK